MLRNFFSTFKVIYLCTLRNEGITPISEPFTSLRLLKSSKFIQQHPDPIKYRYMFEREIVAYKIPHSFRLSLHGTIINS